MPITSAVSLIGGCKMTGMFGMKPKVCVLALAAIMFLLWFLDYTEDGHALGQSFVYFIKTIVHI